MCLTADYTSQLFHLLLHRQPPQPIYFQRHHKYPRHSQNHPLHFREYLFNNNNNNNNNNKDFIYRGGHVTAEKLTNLWPSTTIGVS